MHSPNEFHTAVSSSPSRGRDAARHAGVWMRRAAGVAPLRFRPIALATFVLLGLCAIGFPASVALAGHPSLLQVTTEQETTSMVTATTTPTAAATTTGPAPDPKPPPPPPEPDPKPKRTRVTPVPAPPPPPPPAASQSTTPTATAPAPPPPPSVAVVPGATTVAPAAKRTPRPPQRGSTRQTRSPHRRTPSAEAASRGRSQFSKTEQALPRTAVPSAELGDVDSAGSGLPIVFVSLFGVGLLLVGASTVPLARIPWPVVSGPLYEYRSDLAAIGLGTIALAFLMLTIGFLL
jgi:hypothetical protein